MGKSTSLTPRELDLTGSRAESAQWVAQSLLRLDKHSWAPWLGRVRRGAQAKEAP